MILFGVKNYFIWGKKEPIWGRIDFNWGTEKFLPYFELSLYRKMSIKCHLKCVNITSIAY